MNQHCLSWIARVAQLAGYGLMAIVSEGTAFATPVTPAAEQPIVVQITVQSPDGYKGNPASLLTPLRQDLTEIRLQRLPDGHYDVALGPSADAPTAHDVDLRVFIPRIPDLAGNDAVLRRIALSQREFNRNEVSLGPVASADDMKLANNCLRAGLWEVMLVKKVDGSNKLTFHGWFTFPREEYARLFEEVNGEKYAKTEKLLAAYPEMGAFEVPLATLRKQQGSEHKFAVETRPAGIPLRFSEQTRKAKLLLTSGIATYGDFFANEHQPVTTAKFSEPGFYDSDNPMRFDLRWLANPVGATVRGVRAPHSNTELTELEIGFRDGKRLIIADEGLTGLPARNQPPQADADVLRLTFGIETPEISLPVTDRLAEYAHPRHNYLLLVDAGGKAVDNHFAGVDRVFLWHEAGSPEKLHVSLVGYERITVIDELVLDWPLATQADAIAGTGKGISAGLR